MLIHSPLIYSDLFDTTDSPDRHTQIFVINGKYTLLFKKSAF